MNALTGRSQAAAITLFVAMALAAPQIALAGADQVRFGAPPWPGVTVKTAIARQILQASGYETSVTNASWTINLQSIARADLDADLGIWLPTQKSTVEPMVNSGKIKMLVANVPDARYDVVVPQYVWNAGVHCICDLNTHGGKFDYKIYGIEAGNDGNQIMTDAINNNTYDLADWQLVPSSTAAMLTEAGRAIDRQKWIVFLGWKPHWMNIKYDLRYLEDPEHIWGGQSSVHTVVNPAFARNNPNVTRFLRQMVISSAIQSQWIYDYGYNKRSADAVARRWIAGHMDTVAKWLDGVKTADGDQPAVDAVAARLSS